MEKIIGAFRRGGGEGKPIRVQHGLSWARSEEEAKRGAHDQWRFSALGPDVLAMLRTPKQFEAATRFVTPDDVAKGVRVSADLGQHVAWLEDYIDLGVDTVYLFNANRNQREFIEAFAEEVLPELIGSRSSAGLGGSK
jgi:alkanesulfonate monooxygenase SsuD/methylene tetrahydromethanopterin reductase-like flavin-dependent oxidoreductase (luciferase family)